MWTIDEIKELSKTAQFNRYFVNGFYTICVEPGKVTVADNGGVWFPLYQQYGMLPLFGWKETT